MVSGRYVTEKTYDEQFIPNVISLKYHAYIAVSYSYNENMPFLVRDGPERHFFI